ncbi:MAG: DJ-1/PfpI family protein [Chromatiales bacterium]|nr:DJ-1/PfpI family protein [Chromatiales bacterium]
MTKKILTIVSNFGYWGVELAGPRKKLVEAGYSLTYATPKGERPIALPPSYDTDYMDPPLGCKVTTESDAKLVEEIKDSPELDNPINLSEWFPERPYFSQDKFLRAWEDYHQTVLQRYQELQDYDGVMLVGGSGPLLDMVNNQRVHDVILGFLKLGKPIAAICYGVACLPMARDFNERKSIIQGKHVTGHCIEYDYHDGTGFVGTDLNIGPPPYCLEYLLSDAVGSDGQFHGNFGKPTSVVVDYPFITARSLQCSHEFGEQFVNMLDRGLRRYGW